MRRGARVRLQAALGLGLAVALSACGSALTEGTADASGIAGAGIASAVTKDATVGAAIGLGVRSLADTGLKYGERRIRRHTQDVIAAVAGTLPEGAVGAWHVEHDLPIETDTHGEVAVARELAGGDGFACKEIVFSVDGTPVPAATPGGPPAIPRSYFVATVCRDGAVWKWATAEPAVARWGSLQ